MLLCCEIDFDIVFFLRFWFYVLSFFSSKRHAYMILWSVQSVCVCCEHALHNNQLATSKTERKICEKKEKERKK